MNGRVLSFVVALVSWAAGCEVAVALAVTPARAMVVPRID